MTAAAAARRAITARLPVFAAPMFLVSGPDLVIAACKAGIVGAFPIHNARTEADREAWQIGLVNKEWIRITKVQSCIQWQGGRNKKTTPRSNISRG